MSILGHECEACEDGCLPINDVTDERTEYDSVDNRQCRCPAYQRFRFKGHTFWLCVEHFYYWAEGDNDGQPVTTNPENLG